MSFTSWIDQQINEAAERGLFDNLAGAGKPLADPGEKDFGQAWLRDYVRKEGVPVEEMLPTPLRLRKDIERLGEWVQYLGSEQEVRESVAELNERIMDWRRLPLGPPIFVPLVDEELMVGRWRDGQPAEAPPDAGRPAGDVVPTRARWWRRLRRRARGVPARGRTPPVTSPECRTEVSSLQHGRPPLP
jgi:hypothetical protein